MSVIFAACVFFVHLCDAELTSNGLIYKAVDDEIVLTPDSVPGPITTVTWKHGSDMAVEWYNSKTFAYRHFEGRVMLNSSTGALTITGLTQNDSGSYTPEINNNQAGKPTQLQVISPVSKPSVSTKCDPEMNYCVFTCEGNTTDAEPITYQWLAGDMDLSSTNVHNITKEEKEPGFKCILKNPVSLKSSEEVPNPFITESRTHLFSLIPVVAVILLVCVFFFLYKCRKGKDVEGTAQERSTMLQELHETPVVSPETNNVAAVSSVTVDVPEIPNQNSTSVEPPETNKETVIVEVHKTQTQDSTSPVPPETSDEAERSVMLPDHQETPSQDPTSVVSPDTNNVTAVSTVIVEVHKTQAQDSMSPVSPEDSDEAEVLETQDPTPVASPDTSDETERSSVISETSNQDR